MNDIIKRLREYKIATDPDRPIHPAICEEAAKEIERLSTAFDFITTANMELIKTIRRYKPAVEAARFVAEGRAVEQGTTPLRMRNLRAKLVALDDDDG